MKYWDDSNNGNGKKEITEKEITKENILNLLAFIDRGHLPDWNYAAHGESKTSLPNKYYPIHVAMQVAIKAVEAQDDEFFRDLDEEYNEKQRKVGI